MSRLRSASPRTLAAIATALAAAVAAAVFLVVMADDDLRRTGTNSLVVPSHVVVEPGEELCQPNELVPAGSRYAAPWVGGAMGADGGLVAVTISSDDRVVGRGRSPESYPTGITPIRLDRTVRDELFPATVCFRNESARTLLMYGIPAPPGGLAAQTSDGSSHLVRLDWFGEKSQSWWSYVGAIAERFPMQKAGFLGEWSFWLALVGAVALACVAVVRVLREARP